MDDRPRLLFVRTANQGRSPVAEAILRGKLADRGSDGDVVVSSAGLMEAGAPASAPVVDAARRRGGDLGAHRSRRLTATLVDQSDVVICLAREHARAVVELCEEAGGRTFTLKELVRHVEALGPRRRGQALTDYLARHAAPRVRPGGGGPCGDDDVADPYGRPISALGETADEISELLDRLVSHLWP